MGSLGDILDLIDAVKDPAAALAGWSWDAVVGGFSEWIARGVLQVLMSLWNFMDTGSTASPDNGWFSKGTPGVNEFGTSGPFFIAVQIGMSMAAILLILAVIKAVAAGSPGAVFQSVGRDLPIAAFSAFATVGFSKIAIDIADEISQYVWLQTSPDAEAALGNIIEVQLAASGGTNLAFVGPVLGIFLVIAMMFMWIVLFVRESLIYLVIIYAVAFGFPAMLFPPLRDTSKKVLELLVALIIAKPVMVLAMSVSISALAGVGATAEPGEAMGDSIAKELGTLIVGIVIFGLAAFMPYLTWKLMPIVAAAVVAQGIASAPMRAGMQAAQMQYYGKNVMGRLSGSAKQSPGASNGASDAASQAAPTGGPTPVPGGGGAGLAGGGSAGASTVAAGAGAGAAGAGAGAAGAGAWTARAAPAAGPLAPVVVAAAAVKSTGDAVKSTTKQVGESAASQGSPPPSSPSGGQRDVSGGSQ